MQTSRRHPDEADDAVRVASERRSEAAGTDRPAQTWASRSGSASLLHLQQAAGNRAVRQFVQRQAGAPARPAPTVPALPALPALTLPGSSAGGGAAAPVAAGAAGPVTGEAPPVDAPAVETTQPATASESESAGGSDGDELSGEAAARMAQIDGESRTAAAQVRARAAARRQEVAAHAATDAASIGEVFTAGEGQARQTVDRGRTGLTGWIGGQAESARGALSGLLGSATAAGNGVLAGLRHGAVAVTSTVNGTVGAIAGGILALARALPIPDLPGIGRIRRLVLDAAQSVAGALRRTVAQVSAFVTAAIGSVVDLVGDLLRRAATAISTVISTVTGLISRIATAIGSGLSTLAARVGVLLGSARARTQAQTQAAARAATGRIDAAEAAALSRIQLNGELARASVGQVLDFTAGGDHPEDEALDAHLESNATTLDESVFQSTARAAFAVGLEQQRAGNTEAQGDAETEAGSALAGLRQGTSAYLAEVRTGVGRIPGQLLTGLAQVGAKVREGVVEIGAKILDGARAVITQVTAALSRVLAAALDVVRAPVQALAGVGRSVADGVRGFVSSAISRATSVFGAPPAQEGTGALTAGLAAFTPDRLRAAAQMASPPMAAAVAAAPALVVLGELIAGLLAGVTLGAVLFWGAVVLLVIAVVVLLVLLVKWLLERAPAVPREKARPRAKPRTRRRRRRARKEFRWNLRQTSGKARASGGAVGTLDPNAPLPASAPIEGHHSWPKFVGGPEIQPLMSVRAIVHHTTIHTTIQVPLVAAAAAMGFPITANGRNLAFKAHLRANPTDRAVIAGVLTAYYAGLSARTDPGIPPPAYLLGIGVAQTTM